VIQSSLRLPEGFRLDILDEIDSTNSEALRRAIKNEEPGLWIVAQKQTSGRGRENRRWISQSGNLMASLLLRPEMDLMTSLQLSFVAGVAVHDTVASILQTQDGSVEIKLKWPNDVLINGRKAAGILLESVSDRLRQAPYIAVGIGVNISSHPTDTRFHATDLVSHGEGISVTMVFERLAKSMDRMIRIWQSGRGFETIRRFWLARSHKPGERLTVRSGQTQLEGYFDTIDDDGALCLRLHSGTTKRILVGDVYPQAGCE